MYSLIQMFVRLVTGNVGINPERRKIENTEDMVKWMVQEELENKASAALAREQSPVGTDESEDHQSAHDLHEQLQVTTVQEDHAEPEKSALELERERGLDAGRKDDLHEQLQVTTVQEDHAEPEKSALELERERRLDAERKGRALEEAQNKLLAGLLNEPTSERRSLHGKRLDDPPWFPGSNKDAITSYDFHSTIKAQYREMMDGTFRSSSVRSWQQCKPLDPPSSNRAPTYNPPGQTEPRYSEPPNNCHLQSTPDRKMPFARSRQPHHKLQNNFNTENFSDGPQHVKCTNVPNRNGARNEHDPNQYQQHCGPSKRTAKRKARRKRNGNSKNTPVVTLSMAGTVVTVESSAKPDNIQTRRDRRRRRR